MNEFMKEIVLCFIIFMSVACSDCAADSLTVKFRSRALFDMTATDYGKKDFQGYTSLEDFRVGFKASYGNCGIKADLGISEKKVSIKDFLFDYNWGDNWTLSAGNGYEPFSMDMLISTVDMRFVQSASSVLAFTDGRKLGVTAHYHGQSLYAATGVYANYDVNSIDADKNNSIVSTTRILWRRFRNGGVFHVGGAFSARSASVNNDGPVTGVLESCGVSSMLGGSVVSAEVSDLGSEVKGLAEVLYTAQRFLFQSEYFFDRLNRTGDRKAFLGHGGYVQGSFLLLGRGFGYDASVAVPGRPLSERALELTARVNYTDLNDGRSGIMGGEEWDFSLGLNFYINKYFAVKLSGDCLLPGKNCCDGYAGKLFLGQARVQYIF